MASRFYSHWIVHTCTHTYTSISRIDRYAHLAQSVAVGGAERDELDDEGAAVLSLELHLRNGGGKKVVIMGITTYYGYYYYFF